MGRDKGRILHSSFYVAVKNRASLPKPWRWEIYRVGRKSPVHQSAILYESMTEANRAANAALKLLLTEFPD
jgi:hypothetical protein